MEAPPGVCQGPLLLCPVLTLICLSTQIPTLRDLDPGGFLPHQPVCPNVHKCFGNRVLAARTLSPEQNVSPNQGAVPGSSTRAGAGHGRVGLGENPRTPRSPQAQPGNALLQGIATSFLVGNKTRNLGQDGNTRALPHNDNLPTDNTPFSWGSAALARRPQILLRTSFRPPDPAPPRGAPQG